MRNISNELLSTLIGDIYDCSLNPENWQQALSGITLAFDAAYTAISLADPRNLPGPGRMAAFSPWDAMRLRELNETYGLEGVPGLREVAFGDIDQPRSTLSQMSEVEFHSSDFYQHWVKPQGLREACVTKFVQTNDRVGIMAQITRDTRATIDVDDRNFIALLSPHVRRACMIGDLLNHDRVAVDSYKAALNAINTPVVLTDALQTILFANAAAESLLADQSIISSKSGKLHVKKPEAERAIADAVARTAKAGSDLGHRGIGIPLSLPEEAPSIGYVLPLAGTSERSVFGAATAAVFISLVTSLQPPAETALVALFDLTPTEAKVMCRLGASLDNRSIASELNISVNTIKTHIARIYQKTNVTKQTEIAHLISSLSPSVQVL